MSQTKKNIFRLVISLIASVLFCASFTYAQIPARAELEAQLKKIENEINAQKSAIAEKQKESASLSRDVSILGSKVINSQARIKAQSLQINNLSGDINEKVGVIKELTAKTTQQKLAIGQILRKKNELDGSSFAEFVLSQKTFTEFFADEDSYGKVQEALKDSYKVLNESKETTQKVKESLENQKDEAETLKELQEIEKQKAVAAQNEKNKILKITKGQEANYKKVLADREKEAAKVRVALFSLQDGSSIKFGTLYDFAKRAQASTGVRAAFIMAVMSQETNLGANTGQCYMKDSGGGLVSISSGASRGEMRPNSVQPFISITQAVGRDTFKTKVSCAFQGYGGAMGIAQFMPATWMSIKKRIENASGADYADPWNNYHGVTAMGIFLSDLGAAKQTEDAERNAACRYYSGRSCSAGVGNAYGNSVLRKEASIQAQIDLLQGE